MPLKELSEEQRECKHDRALRIHTVDETYTKYGVTRHKVGIYCADCEVCIALAGTLYVNRTEAIKGIIEEHWPALIHKCARTH